MNSKKTWGGQWTELKLEAFEKYVNSYLTIMNSYRDKYNWKLIYFDGFAGSGTRSSENPSELFNELFPDEQHNCNPYKGAAERVLGINQRGFDYYYFIDKDEDSNEKLKKKLEHYNKNDKKLIFRASDANEQIKRLANALKENRKYKALVLLDPFGMQIDWDSIATLQDLSCDLWILIPSGVIINRLLDRQGNLLHIDKLTTFFGMTEEDIRSAFYTKRYENSLFGDNEIIEKIKDPINKITELYINKLGQIFPNVTPTPLVLYNRNKVPIYHFAFASKNKTAIKIADNIVGRINE